MAAPAAWTWAPAALGALPEELGFAAELATDPKAELADCWLAAAADELIDPTAAEALDASDVASLLMSGQWGQWGKENGTYRTDETAELAALPCALADAAKRVATTAVARFWETRLPVSAGSVINDQTLDRTPHKRTGHYSTVAEGAVSAKANAPPAHPTPSTPSCPRAVTKQTPSREWGDEIDLTVAEKHIIWSRTTGGKNPSVRTKSRICTNA
ncbi:hypothetical protein BD779DRAFT_1473716 [Infundibulicybe gibba]|nr:hypothetical protein BD779DRAFT_1473716 [Infundibulicybe gibba]